MSELQNLVYIELPFMEDMRHYEFAPVFNDECKPTDQQLAAMDQLVDSMMLTNDSG